MDKCPHCGSTRIYPSRHRGAGERLHQVFTEKRPYRCHHCGWREWAQIEVRIPAQQEIDPQTLRRPHPNRPLAPDEFDQLDLPKPGEENPSHHPGPLTPDELDEIEPEK